MMRFGTAEVVGLSLEQAWLVCAELDATSRTAAEHDLARAVTLSVPMPPIEMQHTADPVHAQVSEVAPPERTPEVPSERPSTRRIESDAVERIRVRRRRRLGLDK